MSTRIRWKKFGTEYVSEDEQFILRRLDRHPHMGYAHGTPRKRWWWVLRRDESLANFGIVHTLHSGHDTLARAKARCEDVVSR